MLFTFELYSFYFHIFVVKTFSLAMLACHVYRWIFAYLTGTRMEFHLVWKVVTYLGV